jgi:hypothetical protein
MLWRYFIVRVDHLKLASCERYPKFYIKIVDTRREDMENYKE